MADKIQHSPSEEDLRVPQPEKDAWLSQLMEVASNFVGNYIGRALILNTAFHAPEPIHLLPTPPPLNQAKCSAIISLLSGGTSPQGKAFESISHNQPDKMD